MLIDTHCHLTHERYGADLPGVLASAVGAGVGGVVAIASGLGDADAVARLPDRRDADGGEEWPDLWGTAGVHPHEAEDAPRRLRDRLVARSSPPGAIVALGECGLDYHYDFSPREVQRRVLGAHLEAASETGLPLVVHCRAAEGDMTAVVREAGEGGVRGVLHCFAGDDGLLDAALEEGWLVSLTGLVTFPSFAGAGAVRRIPGDRYMLETDGPYMAPVPRRGRRNEPAFLPHIRDGVARLRDETPSEVERATTANARRFFGLPGS